MKKQDNLPKLNEANKNKEKSKQQGKIKRCPMGGQCFNPLCMFGCIEN